MVVDHQYHPGKDSAEHAVDHLDFGSLGGPAKSFDGPVPALDVGMVCVVTPTLLGPGCLCLHCPH